MTDYADLEKRLRERGEELFKKHARAIEGGIGHPDHETMRLHLRAADALASLTRELEEARNELGMLALELITVREALAPFAECAKELEGSEDVPRAPDGEWAKFRLLTDDYRRAASALGLSRARSEEDETL